LGNDLPILIPDCRKAVSMLMTCASPISHGLPSALRKQKAGERFLIASTQAHFTMDGRDLLRESSGEEYVKDREVMREEADH